MKEKQGDVMIGNGFPCACGKEKRLWGWLMCIGCLLKAVYAVIPREWFGKVRVKCVNGDALMFAQGPLRAGALVLAANLLDADRKGSFEEVRKAVGFYLGELGKTSITLQEEAGRAFRGFPRVDNSAIFDSDAHELLPWSVLEDFAANVLHGRNWQIFPPNHDQLRFRVGREMVGPFDDGYHARDIMGRLSRATVRDGECEGQAQARVVAMALRSLYDKHAGRAVELHRALKTALEALEDFADPLGDNTKLRELVDTLGQTLARGHEYTEARRYILGANVLEAIEARTGRKWYGLNLSGAMRDEEEASGDEILQAAFFGQRATVVGARVMIYRGRFEGRRGTVREVFANMGVSVELDTPQGLPEGFKTHTCWASDVKLERDITFEPGDRALVMARDAVEFGWAGEVCEVEEEGTHDPRIQVQVKFLRQAGPGQIEEYYTWFLPEELDKVERGRGGNIERLSWGEMAWPVLPVGSQVRVDAGERAGQYGRVVADCGTFCDIMFESGFVDGVGKRWLSQGDRVLGHENHTDLRVDPASDAAKVLVLSAELQHQRQGRILAEETARKLAEELRELRGAPSSVREKDGATIPAPPPSVAEEENDQAPPSSGPSFFVVSPGTRMREFRRGVEVDGAGREVGASEVQAEEVDARAGAENPLQSETYSTVPTRGPIRDGLDQAGNHSALMTEKISGCENGANKVLSSVTFPDLAEVAKLLEGSISHIALVQWVGQWVNLHPCVDGVHLRMLCDMCAEWDAGASMSYVIAKRNEVEEVRELVESALLVINQKYISHPTGSVLRGLPASTNDDWAEWCRLSVASWVGEVVRDLFLGRSVQTNQWATEVVRACVRAAMVEHLPDSRVFNPYKNPCENPDYERERDAFAWEVWGLLGKTLVAEVGP